MNQTLENSDLKDPLIKNEDIIRKSESNINDLRKRDGGEIFNLNKNGSILKE